MDNKCDLSVAVWPINIQCATSKFEALRRLVAWMRVIYSLGSEIRILRLTPVTFQRDADLTNASQEFQVTPGSCNFRQTAKTTFESPSQPRNAVIRDRVKNFYGRSIWREDLHF